MLSTLIMFAIIQGLYHLREDEEEAIERSKEQQKRTKQKNAEKEKHTRRSAKRPERERTAVPLSAGHSHKAMEQKRVVLTKRSEQPFVKHSGNAKMPGKKCAGKEAGQIEKCIVKNTWMKKETIKKTAKTKAGIRNKEFTRITYVFVSLFLVMMGYIVYFNAVKSKDVINSPYNKRQEAFADRVVRGNIL